MITKEKFDLYYNYVEEYIKANNMPNSLIALPLVTKMLENFDDDYIRTYHLPHAISIARMIINLDLPFDSNQKDIALAASLCHVIPESMDYANLVNYGLDQKVDNVVRLITRKMNTQYSNEEYYKHIQEDKIALFIKLVDRSDLVTELHSVTVYKAKQYISETRKYFLPMCVYAKEIYPESYGSISILMEKMRCVVDACDILIERYESQENQLIQESLRLKEENSRLRTIINSLKQD